MATTKVKYPTRDEAIKAGEKWFNKTANPGNGAFYQTQPAGKDYEGETYLIMNKWGTD